VAETKKENKLRCVLGLSEFQGVQQPGQSILSFCMKTRIDQGIASEKHLDTFIRYGRQITSHGCLEGEKLCLGSSQKRADALGSG